MLFLVAEGHQAQCVQGLTGLGREGGQSLAIGPIAARRPRAEGSPHGMGDAGLHPEQGI